LAFGSARIGSWTAMTAGNISVIALALAVASSGVARACDCPKAYMVKKYGTVAVAPPPARPPAPSTPTGEASAERLDRTGNRL
jgi:hypothetical protein